MSKKKKIIIIIVSVVAALLLAAGGAAFWYVNSKLNKLNFDDGEEWGYVSGSDVSETDEDLPEEMLSSADLSGTDISGSDISQTDVSATDDVDASETVELIEPVGGDVFNILLFGTDERGKKFSNTARSDSMTICSINRKTNKIKLVSLERSMTMKMPNGKEDLLTHAFHYGGPKYVFYGVEKNLGLKIEKYIRVNFNTFKQIVNAVGGVDIKLTSREAQYLNLYFKEHKNLNKYKVKKGVNHLTGYQALQYCRLRKSDSNVKRIVRQRTCIKAIQTSCKKLSLTEINNLIDTVLPLVKTNLSKTEILGLAAEVPTLINEPIEGMSIPKKVNGKTGGYKKQAKYLKEFLYGDK